MPPTANIGAVSFQLDAARRALLSDFDAQPFLQLGDGTLVGRFAHRGRQYLVIDHRRDPSAASHVERWRSLNDAEGTTPTLLVLCDAA